MINRTWRPVTSAAARNSLKKQASSYKLQASSRKQQATSATKKTQLNDIRFYKNGGANSEANQIQIKWMLLQKCRNTEVSSQPPKKDINVNKRS